LSYEIREIENLDGFLALAPAWDACLAASGRGSPFLTAAWLAAWWRAHGQGRSLRILVAFARERLVAGAPLCRGPGRYYGVSLRETCFVGDGTSDRQGFPVLPGHEAALEAIWRRLRESPRGSAIVRLEEMRADEPAIPRGRGVWPALESERSSLLPYLDLTSGWAAIEAGLPRKYRSEMRTRPKVFDTWGDWSFRRFRGDEVHVRLDETVAVERASHKTSEGRTFYGDPRNLDFMRRLLAEPGPLEPLLSVLEVRGTLVAYLLGFVHDDVYHAYNTAHLPGYEKGSPGKWVMHRTVQACGEDGLRGFDFLRGASYMKSRFRPEDRPNVRAVAFGRGPVPSLLRLAVFRIRPRLLRYRAAAPPAADAE
jgi:CelD/BcsL family acetyltransferase involved in cellulose biosynthesis